MKILVIGNAGSGKSTLGKKIAKHYQLEYFSLDKIVWKEHWKRAPTEEQRARISELIHKDAWVIDGVSYTALAAADQIIFLDMPRRVCFYRAYKRNIRFLFKSRPELPDNCPEILIIPTLIKIIWNFPRLVRPRILTEKKKRKGYTFIHITNRRQLSHYWNDLKA